MDISIYGIGSIGIKRIISHNGNVYLTAEIDIVPAMDTDEPGIKGNNIVIRAEMGSIGLSDRFLVIDASDTGYVNGYAGDSVYLHEVNGDLRVDEITAGNNMILKAAGSIVNVSDKDINAKSRILSSCRQME
jgi:hypothetical protein